MNRPKVSIVVPFHWMKNWQVFLTRCLESVEKQTFKDYEVILTKAGSMPVNSNRAIQSAKGEWVKILYMDDWLLHDEALRWMVNHVEKVNKKEWFMCGTDNHEGPVWTDDIHTGNNKLGSPSALMFRNDKPLLFNETLSWLLDCDLYKRLYERYGEPSVMVGSHVGIGIHEGQMTNILTDEEKLKEHEYLNKKYGSQ